MKLKSKIYFCFIVKEKDLSSTKFHFLQWVSSLLPFVFKFFHENSTQNIKNVLECVRTCIIFVLLYWNAQNNLRGFWGTSFQWWGSIFACHFMNKSLFDKLSYYCYFILNKQYMDCLMYFKDANIVLHIFITLK